MFEKFSRSWGLVKASASVLRADKELMLFPILSSLATLLVLATFALPVFALKLFADGFNVFGAILGFVFYFCQYSVIIFFNSALVLRRRSGWKAAIRPSPTASAPRRPGCRRSSVMPRSPRLSACCCSRSRIATTTSSCA